MGNSTAETTVAAFLHRRKAIFYKIVRQKFVGVFFEWYEVHKPQLM